MQDYSVIKPYILQKKVHNFSLMSNYTFTNVSFGKIFTQSLFKCDQIQLNQFS